MVVDPFHDLIQGVLQGHALAHQLQQESQQQELFERSKVRSQEDDQLRDMEIRQHMATVGRPVTGGMVSDTMDIPDPDVPGQTKTIPYTRAVDKTRPLYKWKDQQVEGYTPQEQATQAARMAEFGKNFTAFSDAARAQKIDAITRETQGAAPPPYAVAAGLWPAGRKVLPGTEMENLQKAAREHYTSHFKTLGEGQTETQQYPFSPEEQAALAGQPGGAPAPQPQPAPQPPGTPTAGGSGAQMNLPPGASPTSLADLQANWRARQQSFINTARSAGAGTPPAGTAPGAQAYPRVVFSSPAKEDAAKEDLDKYAASILPPNADGTPKTRKDLNWAQAKAGLAEIAAAKKVPKSPAEEALLLSSMGLTNALKEMQVENLKTQKANQPTPEEAQMWADHLLNHSLAPSQLGQLSGRDTSKNSPFRRMVSTAAMKTDPNFDFVRAEAEYGLTKDVGFQNKVRLMNSVQESIPFLLQRAQAVGNSPVRSLNKLMNMGKSEFNNVNLKQFQTDAKLVGSEIGSLMSAGGTAGGATDYKLKEAGDILNTSDDVGALAGALGDVNQLLSFRRNALTRGTPYAQPSATAAPAAAAKAQAGPAPNPAVVAPPNPALIAKLPKGNGQQATAAVVRQYLEAYGRDKAAAGKALAAAKWTGF